MTRAELREEAKRLRSEARRLRETTPVGDAEGVQRIRWVDDEARRFEALATLAGENLTCKKCGAVINLAEQILGKI